MSYTPYSSSAPGGALARMPAPAAAPSWRPGINRGTAFTLAEREALGLTGLLPGPACPPWRVSCAGSTPSTANRPLTCANGCTWRTCGTATRCCSTGCCPSTSREMLPVVYTPTVGLAIERFSHEFRRTRGVYLSVDHPEDVETALRNTGLGPDDVDLLVATDSEGILGIGDQGVGGIEIAIGKLAVYTAAAGIHPRRVLPVVLDMGTDNLKLLNDEMYLGARHARVRDQRYDDPDRRLRHRRHQAVPARDAALGGLRRQQRPPHPEQVRRPGAARSTTTCRAPPRSCWRPAISAARAAGTRLRDQRVVIYGAGTAGLGIADMMRDQMIREGLSPTEATRRFYPLGRKGLLIDDDPEPAGLPAALRPTAAAKSLAGPPAGAGIGLAEVVARVHPTILIGTSTHAGAFTEAIVRDMAAHTDRPIIMPLSNPTSKCEAVPADLLAVDRRPGPHRHRQPLRPGHHGGRTYQIAQANNALVFPGLGLGVAVAKASRISDRMIAAAADAVARLSDATTPGAALLPSMTRSARRLIRRCARRGQAAAAEGVAREPARTTRSSRCTTRCGDPSTRRSKFWRPDPKPLEAARPTREPRELPHPVRDSHRSTWRIHGARPKVADAQPARRSRARTRSTKPTLESDGLRNHGHMKDHERLPAPLAANWDWRLDAACRGMDVERSSTRYTKQARTKDARVANADPVCQRWPVVTQCRAPRLRRPGTRTGSQQLSEDEQSSRPSVCANCDTLGHDRANSANGSLREPRVFAPFRPQPRWPWLGPHSGRHGVSRGSFALTV